MLYELPASCPVCKKAFHVRRLGCENCGSTLEGAFELDRLSQLPSEMRQFVIIFLKSRGNIREMEKFYGISYPTVRSRLDEIVALLDGQNVTAGANDILFNDKSGDRRGNDIDAEAGNRFEDDETANGNRNETNNSDSDVIKYSLESNIGSSAVYVGEIRRSGDGSDTDRGAIAAPDVEGGGKLACAESFYVKMLKAGGLQILGCAGGFGAEGEKAFAKKAGAGCGSLLQRS
jgi:hypothetical protein